MHLLPWIALGGAVGAMTRFAVTLWATQILGPRFPWGTLLVNVVGSLLLGALTALGSRASLSPGAAAMLTTGLMGALTTFSTFSVDTIALLQRGDLGWAAANVLGNVVLSVGAAGLGVVVVSRWGLSG